MGKREFIFLAAFMMAVNSLAIDVMLPALQQIGANLGVESENHRQFVVSAYLFGFGLAQLFFGPISDRFGRRKPLFIGLVIYICSAFGIALIPSFGGLLVLRFIQGIGAAATRVITISIVRDIYGGRQMAEVMSLISMTFMIVPVIAPGTGQLVMLFSTWHMIFVFIGVMATLILLWAYNRLPETLAPANVRPFTAKSVIGGFKVVLTNRSALCYTLATTVVFGALFGFINSAQQVFVDVFHAPELFTTIFALIAMFMAASSLLNSRIVGKLGMRRVSHGALLGYIALTGIHALVALAGHESLWSFAILQGGAMFCFGLIGPNFGAMAMEPLGHVAGTASSVQGFVTTVIGALLGFYIGQHFNGTVVPLTLGFALCGLAALVVVLIVERGRLFHPAPGRS